AARSGGRSSSREASSGSDAATPSVSAVRTKPGEIANTPTPRPATSAATDCVNESTAAFAAAYPLAHGRGTVPARLATFTILPPPGSQPSRKARVQRKVPLRLTSPSLHQRAASDAPRGHGHRRSRRRQPFRDRPADPSAASGHDCDLTRQRPASPLHPARRLVSASDAELRLVPPLRRLPAGDLRRPRHVAALRELPQRRPARSGRAVLPATRSDLHGLPARPARGLRPRHGDLPRLRVLLVLFGQLGRARTG